MSTILKQSWKVFWANPCEGKAEPSQCQGGRHLNLDSLDGPDDMVGEYLQDVASNSS